MSPTKIDYKIVVCLRQCDVPLFRNQELHLEHYTFVQYSSIVRSHILMGCQSIYIM